MENIKFRVWNKGTALHAPRMISFEEALKTLTLTTLFGDKKSDRYEILLSTGLFDKNGVEIYIGDIVTKWNAQGKNTKRLAEVCFKQGSLLAIENKGYPSEKMWNLWSMCKNFEVIGNIYEKQGAVR